MTSIHDIPDSRFDDLRERGAAAGDAAAAWVVDDFNSRDFSVDQLESIADDDSDVLVAMFGVPSPLSGEWAGGSMAELLELDGSEDAESVQFLADEYEQAYHEAWNDAIVSAAADTLRDVRVDSLRDLTPNGLARLADCYSPVSDSSEGADWLALIRDSVHGHLSYQDADYWERAHVFDDVHEIADGCVPIYTWVFWRIFSELGAFNEDPTDLGFDGSDMEQGARLCLYMIAERLVGELFEMAGLER